MSCNVNVNSTMNEKMTLLPTNKWRSCLQISEAPAYVWMTQMLWLTCAYSISKKHWESFWIIKLNSLTRGFCLWLKISEEQIHCSNSRFGPQNLCCHSNMALGYFKLRKIIPSAAKTIPATSVPEARQKSLALYRSCLRYVSWLLPIPFWIFNVIR